MLIDSNARIALYSHLIYCSIVKSEYLILSLSPGLCMCSCCSMRPSASLPSSMLPLHPLLTTHHEHRSSSVAELRRRAREHSEAIAMDATSTSASGMERSQEEHA